MKFYRVWAIARKEFIHIIRDPRSIAMGIAMPVVLLLLFGYALTLDVDNVPIVIWDQSDSPASREFISRFEGSRYFRIEKFVHNYKTLERYIDLRKALAGLVIPRDFAGRIESGRPARVQWIVDGTDSNTATIATGYAEGIVLPFSQEITLREIRKIHGKYMRPPVEFRPRVWFNEDLESKNFIIPGLIAVIMMVIAALMTSLTVAREWERGTLEQLISTPVKGPELIFGKLLPYFLVGMFDVLVAIIMSQVLFHVPLRGNLIFLFSTGAVFLAGALSMGLLISITAKNQLLANQLALLGTFIPAFILSGFAFPINNMPPALKALTYLIPAKYMVFLLKGIFLKGVGIRIMYWNVILLALFSVVMVGLAVIKFRKKID